MSVAGPWPSALFREIHGDSERADHTHSRCVVTVKVPLPPAAGDGELLPLTETPHLSIEGPTTLTFVELPQAVTITTAAMHPARISVRHAAREKGIIRLADQQRTAPMQFAGPSEAACRGALALWAERPRLLSLQGQISLVRGRQRSRGDGCFRELECRHTGVLFGDRDVSYG